MARGSESGGGGRVLWIIRAVIVAGCALLAVFLIVALLVALVFRGPTAEEVVQAFRDEGLEAGEVEPISPGGDRSFVPKTYEEQVRFSLPSQGSNIGGRVFTFESQEDLEPVLEHFEGFEGFLSSYVYVEGDVLVQIPGQVPEEEAERYGEVLREL